MPDNPLIKRNTRRNIKKGLTRIGGKNVPNCVPIKGKGKNKK